MEKEYPVNPVKKTRTIRGIRAKIFSFQSAILNFTPLNS